MTRDFQSRRRNDRKIFYCPAGHAQHYTGETEESKLRRELERQRSMTEAAEARAHKIAQEHSEIRRAHLRMRTRVMNGVCPCCNRSFQNLLRHMQTEHAGDLTLKNLRTAFGMTQTDVAKEIGIRPGYVSNYENGKYVPKYAKEEIAVWLSTQGPKA